jgi:tRNA threonylcarbamoyladenosine biosynthesis protein TsaB
VSDETWLAIDTATDVASVAVMVGEQTFAHAVRGARQQSAQILSLIEQILAQAKLSLAQISGIVVGDGPGSFTGLRIGWAAAKGLVQERHLPLITIPSMLAAAHAAGVETVAACYDALRGQVFGAMYRFVGDEVKTIVAPDLFTIPALVQRARRAPDLAVGDGAERYREEILAWTGRAPVGIEALPPLAGSLLALFAYDGARRAIEDPRVAEPVYGRPAEAQVKWEIRHGRPLPHSSR